MSTLLNSLSDKLTAMEQEIQAFPEELNSIVRRLDRHKWESLLARVNEDFNKLLDKLSVSQSSWVLALPLILRLQSLSIDPITDEDRARWRAAHKSDIRVVISKGRVQFMAASDITGKSETIASHKIPFTQQQGYIILSWDQYQKLLDEIGKLIAE